MPGSNGYSTLEDNEERQQQKNSNEQPTTESSPATATNNGGGGVGGGSMYGYDGIIAQMEQEKADMEKRRRRDEKIDAAVAAVNGISDIGNAISNIYAADHYVPSTFDPNNTATAKQNERMAKAKAEYDKRHDAMMSNLQKFQKANADFKFSQQKQEMAQKKWEAEEARKDELNKAKVGSYNAMTKYREAIANKNDAMARKYEEEVVFLQAKAHYLELGFSLKQAESQARIDANEALAAKRRAEAGGTTTTTTIERDNMGQETGRSVTKKPAGEGEPQPKGSGTEQPTKKKANPMGSGKKKNPMS